MITADGKPVEKNGKHFPLSIGKFIDEGERDTDDKRIVQINYHFREIMELLGLNLDDDSLKEAPQHVAKMHVNEIFIGVNPKNKLHLTLFENNYHYVEMERKEFFFCYFFRCKFLPRPFHLFKKSLRRRSPLYLEFPWLS